jgi:hypothetical protein
MQHAQQQQRQLHSTVGVIEMPAEQAASPLLVVICNMHQLKVAMLCLPVSYGLRALLFLPPSSNVLA